MKYPVSKPNLKKNELRYVTKAVKSGWVSSKGEYIEKFEKLFAKKHGMKYGIACSSGTTALTLALASLGIKKGDEVIVPEFTMIATAWVVSYLGAKPVFVDCDKRFLIDIDKIKITPKTKAIIPVHIYGRQCDMKAIKKLGLKIVEDSCEAIGVKPEGDIACYSLFANKIITAGEGGICLTNNKKLAEKMKYLRAMAFDPDHTFLHKEIGFNFRMTNLQAAVALAQTERLKKFLEKRKKIEKWYDQYLAGIKEIRIMPKRKVLWQYDILVENREELMKFLAKNGIETRRFFKPMSQQLMYLGNYKKTMAYCYSLFGLYLPTYYDLTEKDVKFICNKIREFYENASCG